MHIAIDAAPSSEKLTSGIPTFTVNLVKSLLALDDINKYTIYGIAKDNKYFDSTNDNVQLKRMPNIFINDSFWYFWTSWHYAGLPVQLLLDKPDIYISMYPQLPLYYSGPKIVVVHDITPLVLKDTHSFRFKLFFKNQLLHALRHSEKIIAVSQSTKTDLVNTCAISPDKITVIHNAYDKTIFKPKNNPVEIAVTRKKYNIDSKYILYVGTLEPKKNISRLLEAFSNLKKESKIKHKLVIGGKRSWADDIIFHTVTKLGLENEVIFTGYLPQKDTPLLMAGAEVFIFPSLHEGFGIPPLEAMACGTPVVASNIASLKEVVGDAGTLVDPYNVDTLAKAIYDVISNDQHKERMKQKSLERAKLFSWEESARKLLALFESILDSQKLKNKL